MRRREIKWKLLSYLEKAMFWIDCKTIRKQAYRLAMKSAAYWVFLWWIRSFIFASIHFFKSGGSVWAMLGFLKVMCIELLCSFLWIMADLFRDDNDDRRDPPPEPPSPWPQSPEDHRPVMILECCLDARSQKEVTNQANR